MPFSRSLITSAAVGAALFVPSSAGAAQELTGVTSTGQVATFQSDATPGLKSLVKVSGLGAGERVVGLDRTPDGHLLALTSAGRVATLDATSGKATMKYSAPVTAAIDGSGPVTFAVAPDGATVRIIAPGRDQTLTLATGAVAPSAPAQGGRAPHRPRLGGQPADL